jgi:phage regulator Rha-like protein
MELTILDKKLVMDSRDIAELTHKRHADVMRDIRDMFEKMGAKVRSSFKSTYLDKYGREKPCYRLPYRELLLLLTGYSVPLRAAVIDRWAFLERRYKNERSKSIETRNTFTDELKIHGYEKRGHYIKTTTDMKNILEIKHKKDDMSERELKAVRASEAMASLMLTDEYGFHEVNPVCMSATQIVENALSKSNKLLA